jgi:hypothetical protein
VFLVTGTLVVCLKRVGITDSDKDRLKMSVKSLSSWSAHAWNIHIGNVGLFKGLTHIGYGERDYIVIPISVCVVKVVWSCIPSCCIGNMLVEMIKR